MPARPKSTAKDSLANLGSSDLATRSPYDDVRTPR